MSQFRWACDETRDELRRYMMTVVRQGLAGERHRQFVLRRRMGAPVPRLMLREQRQKLWPRKVWPKFRFREWMK